MAREKRQTRIKKNKTKILIVDDHPIVRQGLAELINHEKDLTVCGQAEDAHRAMRDIKALKPDIVIVDILLKGANGLELIKDIKSHYPGVAVLTLSMHDESLYAERALRAGARGYIMKQEATDRVIVAIRKVLTGQIYISQRMAEKMMNKLIGAASDVTNSPIESLSDRELEVFSLIGRGHGTRQIAEDLHLSIKTIET